MTVTLETLRAEFERARDHAVAAVLSKGRRSGKTMTLLYIAFTLNEATAEECSSKLNERQFWLPDELVNAAKLYVIASDEGLEAAMLFKLSNGAIDHRGEVQG